MNTLKQLFHAQLLPLAVLCALVIPATVSANPASPSTGLALAHSASPSSASATASKTVEIPAAVPISWTGFRVTALQATATSLGPIPS